MNNEEEIRELQRKAEALRISIENLEERFHERKKSVGSDRYLIANTVLAFALIVSYQFLEFSNLAVEIISISILTIHLIISAYFKLDFRMIIPVAIILFLFCAVTLSFDLNLAIQLGIIGYAFLTFGTIGLTIEYLGKKDSDFVQNGESS